MLLGLIALPAQSAPLTLEEALRLAQERSRQLPAQDAAAVAAREMAVAAGQRPDPTLKAGISNLPVNGEDRFSLTRDFMTMRSVGVMQELTRDSKLRARSARYERDAEVAEAGRTLALANLQRDTAIAWLDRFYQERMRDVLSRQRDEARLQIEAADAAYRGGRGSQADVFAARSAVAQIEDRIAQADRQLATAKTQLARWVGVAAGEPLASVPSLDTVRLRAEDLEAQIAHHPQIAVLRGQEAAAQADVELAQANKRPDWSVELMFSQRGPAYSNMVSVNVSVPLQWDQTNDKTANSPPSSRCSSRRVPSAKKKCACTLRRRWRCCRSGAATASGCSATTPRCCRWPASARRRRWPPTGAAPAP